MRYILEFETEVSSWILQQAVKNLGLVSPIIVLSQGISIEDRGAGDFCLKRPGIVEQLKKEVNDVSEALHSCAGIGDFEPPYPEQYSD